MKFLLTGPNGIHSGHNPKLNYVSAVLAIKSGLERLPETAVEIRPVIVGEDLSGYDGVVVFLASMRGFLCKHTLGTLWALYSRPDAVIAFDDWQTTAAVGGIKSAQKEWERILTENPFGYAQIEKMAEPALKAGVSVAIDKLSLHEWDWNVLMPVYLGGDMSKLGVPAKRIFPFNPSIVFKGHYSWVEPNFEPWKTRQKKWIMAALHDHTRWAQKKIGVKWPIEAYGCRKLDQPRVQESELFGIYQTAVGVLSPEYKSCGSGWWRARYGFAADALSVILGSPQELAMVDKEAYGYSASQIEAMSDQELFDLALRQREAYYRAAGSYEDMIHYIAAAMP